MNTVWHMVGPHGSFPIHISVIQVCYFSFDPSISGFVYIPSTLIICLEVATTPQKSLHPTKHLCWPVADCFEKKEEKNVPSYSRLPGQLSKVCILANTSHQISTLLILALPFLFLFCQGLRGLEQESVLLKQKPPKQTRALMLPSQVSTLFLPVFQPHTISTNNGSVKQMNTKYHCFPSVFWMCKR